jgi:hypothetical protein
MIATMWVLTLVSGLFELSGNMGMAILIDIPAFIIAIVLVTRRNGTDKANGWVKLSLEIIAFLVAFAAAQSHAVYLNPFGYH